MRINLLKFDKRANLAILWVKKLAYSKVYGLQTNQEKKKKKEKKREEEESLVKI